jgi:hypothetical protein
VNLPDSITVIVAQAATLPPPLMRLLIKRSLAQLPAQARRELWDQIKDVDVTALETLKPEQWPDTVPPAMQKGVLLMIAVAQESLRKEMTP